MQENPNRIIGNEIFLLSITYSPRINVYEEFITLLFHNELTDVRFIGIPDKTVFAANLFYSLPGDLHTRNLTQLALGRANEGFCESQGE